MYTIGQVEHMTGITRAMLKDYERKGVLIPSYCGENASSDKRFRKLYSDDDIERLKKITILLTYGFHLKEIKMILDSEDVNIFDILSSKIEELKREENRLRNLILFAKFVNITDTDVIEGFIHGPEDIDIFADALRETAIYRDAMQKIRSYDEEELKEIFKDLDEIIEEFACLDADEGFEGVERQINKFCTWWDINVASVDECGYLGFWAIFEDDGIIPKRVEEVGGELTSASLQMDAFYVYMKRLMMQLTDSITRISDLSKSDIVGSMEIAEKLICNISSAMGIDPTAGSEKVTQKHILTNEAIDLSESVLTYMEEMLEDKELMQYIDPTGEIDLDPVALLDAGRVLNLMEDITDGNKTN